MLIFSAIQKKNSKNLSTVGKQLRLQQNKQKVLRIGQKVLD